MQPPPPFTPSQSSQPAGFPRSVETLPCPGFPCQGPTEQGVQLSREKEAGILRGPSGGWKGIPWWGRHQSRRVSLGWGMATGFGDHRMEPEAAKPLLSEAWGGTGPSPALLSCSPAACPSPSPTVLETNPPYLKTRGAWRPSKKQTGGRIANGSRPSKGWSQRNTRSEGRKGQCVGEGPGQGRAQQLRLAGAELRVPRCLMLPLHRWWGYTADRRGDMAGPA